MQQLRPLDVACPSGSALLSAAVDRWFTTCLTSRACYLLASSLLTFPFWRSGLAKLIFFEAGVSGIWQFGVEPAVPVDIAVITVQLVGSMLIVTDRLVWLGAGMLGVFTLLTIPMAHHFWNLQAGVAASSFNTAMEHLGMVGGLLGAAMLSALRRVRATGQARTAGDCG